MPTVTLSSTAGERALTDEEIEALMWGWKVASGGPALGRLLVAGGQFDAAACEELLEFCRTAWGPLALKPLEILKPRYATNVCLGSEAGYQMILRHKCAYVNKNTVDCGVFVAKRRQPEGVPPNTFIDVPPFRAAIAALESAAMTGQFIALHSAPAEYF